MGACAGLTAVSDGCTPDMLLAGGHADAVTQGPSWAQVSARPPMTHHCSPRPHKLLEAHRKANLLFLATGTPLRSQESQITHTPVSQHL